MTIEFTEEEIRQLRGIMMQREIVVGRLRETDRENIGEGYCRKRGGACDCDDSLCAVDSTEDAWRKETNIRAKLGPRSLDYIPPSSN